MSMSVQRNVVSVWLSVKLAVYSLAAFIGITEAFLGIPSFYVSVVQIIGTTAYLGVVFEFCLLFCNCISV